MLFRRWLAQARFFWERRKLVKKGDWGNTLTTQQFLLSALQTVTFDHVDLKVARGTGLVTRSGNVDDFLQALRRARYCMESDDSLVEETMRKYAPFDRTVDDYLLTVDNVPIAPTEVRRVLTEEFQPILDRFKDLGTRDVHREQYYRRHLEWMLVELREVLDALLAVSDQRLKS